MKAKCIIARSSFLYGIVAGTIPLTFSAITYGQQLIYNGSPAQLENASSALPNSEQSLGISDSAKGLIYRNSGNSVTSGADLVINYSNGTSPQFVIGGFNDQGNGTEVKSNRVTITNGQVEGPVYGGLSFVSKVVDKVDKSSSTVTDNNSAISKRKIINNIQTVNHNQVEVKGKVEVEDTTTRSNVDVYGGNVTLWNQIDNVTAGEAKSDTTKSVAKATAEANLMGSGNASANENKVVVKQGGKAPEDVYGGRVTIRTATGNAKAGKSENKVINTGSGIAESKALISTNIQVGSSANGNTVEIEDLAQAGHWCLGCRNSILSGGSIFINTIAGNADNASVDASSSVSNTDSDSISLAASASASTISFASANATANENKVIIGKQARIESDITGGNLTIYTNAGDATAGMATTKNNSIDASASLNAYAYAEATTSASTNVSKAAANKNQVFVQKGVDTTNFTVISGGATGGNVEIATRVGNATAGKATAENNIINDASASIEAYAEAIASTDVSVETNRNQVIVLGDYISIGSVTGGNVTIITNAGNATASDAIIKNASASNTEVSANAYATTSATTKGKVSADENEVLVKQGKVIIRGDVTGGNVMITTSTGKATAGNITTEAKVDASQLDNLATVSANNHISASANGNTVTIEQGAQVEGLIAGGQILLDLTTNEAIGGQLVNGVTTTGDAQLKINVSNTKLQANGNQIYIDGEVQGHVYGGYIRFNIDPKSNDTVSLKKEGSSVQAINNIITIGEHATFRPNSGDLYGGYLSYNESKQILPEGYDVFTGNTLNYAASTPSKFGTVANFAKYNFTLTPDNANSPTPLITATNKIVLGSDTSNISKGPRTSSDISVVGIHSGKILSAGDHFILMQSDGTFIVNGSTDTSVSQVQQAQQGISLLYDVQTKIDPNNKQVTATILGPQGSSAGAYIRANPQLKALSEGRLSALTQLTRGADVVAYDIFDKMRGNDSFTPFIITSGSRNRYNSGSHIKTNDSLFVGGITYTNAKLKSAAFIEMGRGNYDTYNSFYKVANTHGSGHNKYTGLGVVAKYQFTHGLYTDGSLRFGRSHNKYSSNDIRNIATGERAKYSINSPYISAHVGTGYIFSLDKANTLDFSTKYLWTHLASKNVIIASDPIHFDAIESRRVRFQSDFTHQYSENIAFNVGLGYEYEFGSKANGTTYDNFKIEAPSIKGGTGVATIGLVAKPNANSPWKFNINLQGYSGKRQGGAGSVMINYAF